MKGELTITVSGARGEDRTELLNLLGSFLAERGYEVGLAKLGHTLRGRIQHNVDAIRGAGFAESSNGSTVHLVAQNDRIFDRPIPMTLYRDGTPFTDEDFRRGEYAPAIDGSPDATGFVDPYDYPEVGG